jgi:hypothetical protein
MKKSNSLETSNLLNEVAKNVELFGATSTIKLLQSHRDTHNHSNIFDFIIDSVCSKYNVSKAWVLSNKRPVKTNQLAAIKFICFFLSVVEIKVKTSHRAAYINRSLRMFQKYSKEINEIKHDKDNMYYSKIIEIDGKIKEYISKNTR